ncbi:hypothetical protein T01_12207 [Trichinella spiralis]|uniref:Uncharacterized protein n=1 Tax=Trichinella spiralis TaxID=6334 RepID=A0A0V1BMV8_TRISP|nr:hypothetical protein T01_12207 [Trichinella spiralis]
MNKAHRTRECRISVSPVSHLLQYKNQYQLDINIYNNQGFPGQIVNRDEFSSPLKQSSRSCTTAGWFSAEVIIPSIACRAAPLKQDRRYINLVLFFGNFGISIIELNKLFFTRDWVVTVDDGVSAVDSNSSAQCYMARSLAASSSNSTIASDLSYFRMPFNRSCRESKKRCSVRSNAVDTSRIAPCRLLWCNELATDPSHVLRISFQSRMSQLVSSGCSSFCLSRSLPVIVHLVHPWVAGSNPAQRTKTMLENPFGWNLKITKEWTV